MKIRYLVLLVALLFIVGCAQKPAATPAAKPTAPAAPEVPAVPEPVKQIQAASILIKDRTATPAELTVAPGTEVMISVEGTTPHIVQVVKAAEGSLGPRFENLGTLKEGSNVKYIFKEAGTYTIKSAKVGSVSVAVTVK